MQTTCCKLYTLWGNTDIEVAYPLYLMTNMQLFICIDCFFNCPMNRSGIILGYEIFRNRYNSHVVLLCNQNLIWKVGQDSFLRDWGYIQYAILWES